MPNRNNSQKIPNNFIATVYGDLMPLNNSALSRARLRIFYKGLNRNGSFISDEVADLLIQSLPGTPIVGYFDADKDDFLGHVEREKNIAYGFVPQDMNFKWEMFLDPDGIYRTYACADIILWTGRYPIASKIVGRSHSMELNDKTVAGDWVEDENDYYFKFTNAEFIGLCVLGDDFNPCFEGSSFYSLNNTQFNLNSIMTDVKEMINLYYSINFNNNNNDIGGQQMEDEEVKPQEEEIVNSDTENSTDSVEQGVENTNTEPEQTEESTEVDSEEVETENTETEENVSEDSSNEDSQAEIEELKANFQKQLDEKDEEIKNLSYELEQLRGYKEQKIDEEKEALLQSFSSQLTQSELENFRSKKAEYSCALDLKKDIAVCILEKQENNKGGENSDFSLADSSSEQLSGIEAIVANYVKSTKK